MEEPKKGMCGEICWRRAGVRAGLGSYQETTITVFNANHGARQQNCNNEINENFIRDYP